MPACSSTVETTSHNQASKVPAQDTVDGVHHSPGAETPFATNPIVKRAAGTCQPSASLTHSQGNVDAVGFPGGAHCFPVLSPSLQSNDLQPLHTPQARIIWLGVLRGSRTEWTVLKYRRNVSFAKFYTWRMPGYKKPPVVNILTVSFLTGSYTFPSQRAVSRLSLEVTWSLHIKENRHKNILSNQTTGGKCASLLFSG